MYLAQRRRGDPCEGGSLWGGGAVVKPINKQACTRNLRRIDLITGESSWKTLFQSNRQQAKSTEDKERLLYDPLGGDLCTVPRHAAEKSKAQKGRRARAAQAAEQKGSSAVCNRALALVSGGLSLPEDAGVIASSWWDSPWSGADCVHGCARPFLGISSRNSFQRHVWSYDQGRHRFNMQTDGF
ncbi:hypothetical protein BJY04DRAFT_199006 [Aspergillus karnatakaensis]|uniref:uncharacterized protein n=1 Tax=Aspergillus karnatakaensis TaxID=1810916 RepID=UPI003CCD6191